MAMEERTSELLGRQEDGSQETTKKVGLGEQSQECVMKPSSSNEESSNSKEEDELDLVKAEMGEVREENERLKTMLKQIENDYQSLQLRFFDIVKQETPKKPEDSALPSHDETEEPELVSLCLGRIPSEPKRDDKSSSMRTKESEELKASLTLGLDSKFQMSTELMSNPSPENNLEEMKEDEAGGAPKRNGDDDVAQQSQAKRARVCVRARCDAPTMSDGCQWRKYGQKIAKGNPCPRAYYRCTVAPACPVRKQVQRCAEDMSILITTYEGTHNHPLPVSATAMAATTSAAASMLLSGSSVSQPGPSSHVVATSAPELNGLNFSLYDSTRAKQFYLPNSSSPLFPTITLDLTTSPSSSSPFNRFSSSLTSTSRFPSSLSISSTESSILPTVWGNRYQSTYNAFPYNQPNNIGSLSLGKQHQEQLRQPYMEKTHQPNSQQALTETLTKAITSDPSFRTVIATAISSMIGGNANANARTSNQGAAESFGQNLKLGEPGQDLSSNSLSQNGKGCASSYFNGLSSSTSQAGGLIQPAALPFSIFNSSSMPNNKEPKS